MTTIRPSISGEELLARCLTAHGGLERWRQITAIRVNVVTGGLALASRAQRELRTEAVVSTGEPRVVLSPFRRWPRGIFERDRVMLEDERCRVVAVRTGARSLMGCGRRLLWWDALDTLYFVGYALSTYLRAPFLFAQEGFRVEAGAASTLSCNAGTWQILRVTFPPDEPSHCPTQLYYLDEQDLIRRLDYVAEPIGRWARASHFCADYREFSGLRLATRRWVLPRSANGSVWPWPELMRIAVEPLELVSDVSR